MNYQDPVCGISVIKIMFHGKIPSDYGDHTMKYFWVSFLKKKKKSKQNHKKRQVLKNTDCPELDFVRPYSETAWITVVKRNRYTHEFFIQNL